MTAPTAAAPARRWAGAVLTALVVVAAVVVGLGTGGTLALWRDEFRGAARVPVGVAVFGVGAPAAPGTLSQYATTDGQALAHTFGPAQAAALYNGGAGGSVAIPVQVDALSQGHRGLSYTVVPTISGGVFGASTWRLYRVASAAACTTATSSTEASASTPVPSGYTTTSTLVSEYWCLVATYAPVAGTNEEQAEVTGTPVVPEKEDPADVQDAESWNVTGYEELDPGAEPSHSLTFTFRTFRPGETP
ncbi:hypothetical protein ACFUMH_06845 [Cellulomonas sp. NPDC057328]|uniref:hypothetical protein n=1 Tax=Cellulomonas sp. NPDC057328 TaxID=3346101 RepID=UPI00363EB0E8